MSPLGTQSRGISGKNVWGKHRNKKQTDGTNKIQQKPSTPASPVLKEIIEANRNKGPPVLPAPQLIKSEEQAKRTEKENKNRTIPNPVNGNLRCRIPIRTTKCLTNETRGATKRLVHGTEFQKPLALPSSVRNSARRWLKSARNTIIARRHRNRVLLRETIRDWRMLAEEERKEWRLGIRATAKYKTGLLRLGWEGWRILLGLEKEKARKREQQERIAGLALTRRKFRIWRNLLDVRRTERDRSTLADRARRKFHLARAFGNWKSSFSHNKYWTERDDTAHRMYLRKQRYRVFDLWYNRYLERSALREREDRLRSRHRKQMMQVVLTGWLDYVDYRKLKLDQVRIAAVVCDKRAMQSVWHRWRNRQWMERIGHEKSNDAEKFRGFWVLGRAFWAWKKKYRSSIGNRALVQSLMVARTKIVKQRFFGGLRLLIEKRNTADEWSTKKQKTFFYNKWHDAAMARIAAREEEAMRPGQTVYNAKLIRTCWAAWDKRTAEIKRYGDMFMQACKHRRRNELSRAFGALRAYQSLKATYRKECAIELRFGRRRLLMKTWDVWHRCLTDRAITLSCVQKAREFYIFQIQRKCLLAMRAHACTSLAMQNKKDVAVTHYNAKVLETVVERWHVYSSMRAQNLNLLQLAIDKSLLSLLQQCWRHWIELCKARYFKRRKLFLFELTYRRTVVHRCLHQWKRTATLLADRRRCERGFIDVVERRKLRNSFELWKSKWRLLQYANELLREKQSEKRIIEQRKYFATWLTVLRTNQEEKRKESDRLGITFRCMAESKMRRHFRAWILHNRKKMRLNALHNALRSVRKKKVLHSVIVKWVNEARIKIWQKESAREAVRFQNRVILRIYLSKWVNLRPSYKELYHRTHAQPVLYWSYRTLRKFLGAWHRWAAELAATRELLRKAEERRRRRVTRDACMAWIGGSGSKFQERERKWEVEARRNLVFDGLKSGSILMEANVKRLRGARRCGILWRAEVLARKIERERGFPEAAVSLSATKTEFKDATVKSQIGQTLVSRCNLDTSNRPQPRFPHAIFDAPLFEISVRSETAFKDSNFASPRSQPVNRPEKNQKIQKGIVHEHAIIKALRPKPRLPGFYMDESLILRKTG